MTRKTIWWKLIWLVLALLLAGCSRIPFTQPLRLKHDLSPAVLKGIQYYLSDTLTLVQEEDSKDVQVSREYGIDVVNRTDLETIVIPAETPGIAEKIGKTLLAVSFEPGKYLYFGYHPEWSGEDGRYVLVGEKNVTPVIFSDGNLFAYEWHLKYGNYHYRAISRQYPVYLKVDLNTFHQMSENQRVVPGRRLD